MRFCIGDAVPAVRDRTGQFRSSQTHSVVYAARKKCLPDLLRVFFYCLSVYPSPKDNESFYESPLRILFTIRYSLFSLFRVKRSEKLDG